MIATPAFGRHPLRRAALALALLAVFLRAMVPVGMMAAPVGSTGGFPLVICTGHGALTLDAPQPGSAQPGSPRDKAPAARADGACVFAAPAAPPAPEGAVLARAARVEIVVRALPLPADLAPGRGLAAPPPPSQAPPAFA